jgi:hypothetical protein
MTRPWVDPTILLSPPFMVSLIASGKDQGKAKEHVIRKKMMIIKNINMDL